MCACTTHQPTYLPCVTQEEASSPSTHHTAVGHLAENGASASSLTVDEDAEEEAANAGIAAVVERTLQQAVVSRSLAAGRSGTLGTSDSMEGHASAVPEAGGEPGMPGTLDSLADTEEAPGSHPSRQSQTASLDKKDKKEEAEAKRASAAEALEGATSGAAPGQSGTTEQQPSPDHTDSSSKSDARYGSKQDLLDTGQAGTGLPSSRQSSSTDRPDVSTSQPELDPAHPSSPSRAASATPVKAARGRSQADARALEREYLEGELDALGEKEQEEVGHSAAQLMQHTL